MRVPVLDVERLRAAIAARVPSRWRKPWVGVGLDLDAERVKAVAVRHHGGRPTLLAASVEPIGQPAERAAAAEAIRRVLEAIRFASLRAPVVTTAISGAGVVVRFAAFPAMTLVQLKQAVRFEAEKHIPYQLAEVVLDFHPLDAPSQGQREVLLVAAKKELVEEHLGLLREASLVPHIIDLEAFALANAWEATSAPAGAATVTALVGVEPQRTIVDILTGTRLRLTREFPTGGSGETPEAAPPVVEHLVKQLRLSFDYFENQYGQGVEQVVLSGVANRWAGFAELLHEGLGQPVMRWDPLAAITKAPQVDVGALEAISADLAVAVGLGLRRPGSW